MRRWQPFVIAALVLVVLGVWIKGFWFTDVFTTARQNESNRDALVSLHSKIRLGDTREQVLRDYYAIRTEDLRLHCDRPEEWSISMPLEFGASDWNLRLEFDAGKVSAVRVRTADGPKPDGSPDDKETPNQEIHRTQ